MKNLKTQLSILAEETNLPSDPVDLATYFIKHTASRMDNYSELAQAAATLALVQRIDSLISALERRYDI